MSEATEKALLARYEELCRQMDKATTPGDFRPGIAEAIRIEMAALLPAILAVSQRQP